MVVSIFCMANKDSIKRFFEKSFLLTDLKPDVVLEMSFLTISNTNVNFQARNLQWRFYITKDILSTTIQIKLIRKKEFAATALDLEYEVFVVHVATLSVDLGNKVYPSRKTQIADLKVDKALTKVPNEYAHFADIILPKFAAELPDHGIHNHAMELMNDQQPPYSPIYSLGLVEIETLKTYIKNNLINSFIRPSKSPIEVLIFFDKKPNGNLRLYIDYHRLNNLTI